MAFKLIVEADRTKFEEVVNRHLADDYGFVGSVSYHNSVFVVGMQCEEEEDVATTKGVSGSK